MNAATAYPGTGDLLNVYGAERQCFILEVDRVPPKQVYVFTDPDDEKVFLKDLVWPANFSESFWEGPNAQRLIVKSDEKAGYHFLLVYIKPQQADYIAQLTRLACSVYTNRYFPNDSHLGELQLYVPKLAQFFFDEVKSQQWQRQRMQDQRSRNR